METVRTQLFSSSGGGRDGTPKLVVLVTDANADTDVDQTLTAAETLKGIAICSIALLSFIVGNKSNYLKVRSI